MARRGAEGRRDDRHRSSVANRKPRAICDLCPCDMPQAAPERALPTRAIPRARRAVSRDWGNLRTD